MALLKYLDSLRYLPQIFLCKLPSISMRYQNCSKQISNCNPVSEKYYADVHHSLTHTRTFYFYIVHSISVLKQHSVFHEILKKKKISAENRWKTLMKNIVFQFISFATLCGTQSSWIN